MFLVRSYSSHLSRLFASLMFVAPLALLTFSFPGQVQSKNKTKPAKKEDIFLYRGLGATYVCNARAAGIEFPKAVGIAATTYVQVLKGRHGGIVSSVSKKELSNKQLLSGAEIQIITGALQYCPKEVPKDVEEEIKAFIERQSNSKKKR